MPPLPGPDGDSQHQVNQDGSRREYDARFRRTTTHNPDGSTDTTLPSGYVHHEYPPGQGPNGTTGYDSGPDGYFKTYYATGTTTTIAPDGAITVKGADGSETFLYPPGGDGPIGYYTAPNGVTTVSNRDGSTDTYDAHNHIGHTDPPDKNDPQDPAPSPNGPDDAKDPAQGPNGPDDPQDTTPGPNSPDDPQDTTPGPNGQNYKQDPPGGPNGQNYKQDPPGGPTGQDQQDPPGGPNGNGPSDPLAHGPDGQGQAAPPGPDGQDDKIDHSNGPNGNGPSDPLAHGPDGQDLHNPDSNGPDGDHPAKGTGEPHYYTRDGVEVTTQAAGEFVLVTGVPGRELQARQQPWADSQKASAITALAMRVGDNKVEVRMDGTVLINGEAAPGDAFVQGDLPGGGAVGVWRANNKMTGAVVVWPDLSVVWITMGNRYLNLVAQWRKLAPEHRGILGSNDGNADNDLTDRAGKVHARGDAPGLAAFVESWRVTDAESLFTYAPGESTATYTLRDFPKNPPDLASHRAEAEVAAASLPPGPWRDACIYDIAVTGDPKFAASYQEFAKLSSTVQANSDVPPRKKKSGVAPAPTPTPTPKPTATPSPTATPPVESGAGIAITPAEMAAAAPMESGQKFQMKLGAGESRVYKFIPGKTDNLTIYPTDLSSLAPYRPGVDAGFAWFDDKGLLLGKPHQVHDDGPSPISNPTGTFYLKIVGPGDVDIGHH